VANSAHFNETPVPSAGSQIDQSTDVHLPMEVPVSVFVAPLQEPERPVAVVAMADRTNTTIAPKQTSAPRNGQRKIQPVGEALKNTGCCAYRGGH